MLLFFIIIITKCQRQRRAAAARYATPRIISRDYAPPWQTHRAGSGGSAQAAQAAQAVRSSPRFVDHYFCLKRGGAAVRAAGRAGPWGVMAGAALPHAAPPRQTGPHALALPRDCCKVFSQVVRLFCQNPARRLDAARRGLTRVHCCGRCDAICDEDATWVPGRGVGPRTVGAWRDPRPGRAEVGRGRPRPPPECRQPHPPRRGGGHRRRSPCSCRVRRAWEGVGEWEGVIKFRACPPRRGPRGLSSSANQLAIYSASLRLSRRVLLSDRCRVMTLFPYPT